MERSAPADVEIERKFVLPAVPAELEQVPGEHIQQGYVAIADDGVEVRVRRRGDTTTLTIKSGPGEIRVEEELSIDERRFEALWALTEDRRLSKTRHLVPLGDLTAEVDVYDDRLAGLITAEVEFPSPEDSARFVAPEWLGREVTNDSRYANQSLARRGRPPE
jgi:CYTH domain-containing protein